MLEELCKTDQTLLHDASAVMEPKMLRVVGSKVWLVSNFAQQHETGCANATCNIQQCCFRLLGAEQPQNDLWYCGLISLTTSYYHTIITLRGPCVLITCDARFNEHIYVQVNKANKMLGFIRRSHSSKSDQFLPTFRSLYVVLVRSHLEYASEIWSPKSYWLVSNDVPRGFSFSLLPNSTYNERLQQLRPWPRACHLDVVIDVTIIFWLLVI